jgi:hypothetical protein
MEYKSTFNSGINKDVTKQFLKPDQYRDARNIRINTQGGDSTAAVTNANGTTILAAIPNTSNVLKLELASGISFPTTVSFTINGTSPVTTTITSIVNSYEEISDLINNNATLAASAVNIKAAFNATYVLIWGALTNNITATPTITGTNVSNTSITTYLAAQTNLIPMGWGLIRDEIILFTTNVTSTVPSGTIGQIWRLTYDVVSLAPTLTLLRNNFDDFSTYYSFRKEGQSEGRYENINTKNIYWTDDNNNLRRFNTADPNGFALDPTLLDIRPAIDFDIPTLQSINDSGGQTKVGVYQAAYRLKNSGGATTGFSKPSNLVSLTTSLSTNPFWNFFSTDKQTATISKTITWSIDNIDTDFDRIEIVVIYKEGKDDIPLIDLVIDEPVPQNGSFIFTYTGFEAAIPIDLNTFLNSSSSFTHCKSIASKDNLLIAAKTRNVTFDVNFDARAYRWRGINTTGAPTATSLAAGITSIIPFSSTQTQVVNGQGSFTTVDKNSLSSYPNQWGVNEEHNAINPDQYTQTNDSYRFQSDGITHGGEGPNIKYRFITKWLTGDDVAGFSATTTTNPYGFNSRFTNPLGSNYTLNSNTYPNNNAYDSFKSPYATSLLKGYPHDEIVPFGIQFFDRQGRPGFVKWIADIRMPLIFEALDSNAGTSTAYKTTDRNGFNGAQRVGILMPEFTVNIPTNLQSSISGWQIVRCERTENDKTILAAGVLQQVYYDSFANVYYTTLDGLLDTYVTAGTSVNGAATETAHGLVATFVSPEFQFLKFPGYQAGDKIKVVCNLTQNYTTSVTTHNFSKFYENTQLPTGYFEERVLSSNGSQYLSRPTTTGSSGNATSPSGATIHQYQNVDSGTGDIQTIGDSTVFLEWHSSTALPWTVTSNKFYAYYVRPRTSAYGGNTYSQRANREYISTGHYQEITSTTNLSTPFVVEVAGGDIFTTVFDTQKILKNWVPTITPQANKQSSTLFFPVETVLNTEWRYGNHVNKTGLPDGGTSTDLGEDYLINTVFSSEDNTKKAFPKPVDFLDIQENDNRLYASGFKINGESTDSWGLFNPLDYIDADGQFGPINNLQILKGNLFGLQDRGIFHVPINQRVTIPDNSSSTLLLGTGDKLSRPIYITTTSGCKHQWGNIVSDQALYYFDILNLKLNRITNVDEKISVAEGLDSYFKENITGDIRKYDKAGSTVTTPYGILATFDKNNQDVIFTFKDTTIKPSTNSTVQTSETLAYNELFQCFTSFYDFFPRLYINDGSHVITPSTSSPSTLHMHGTGNPGQFYGTTFDSTLSLLIAPKVSSDVVFDNFMFVTEVKDLNNVEISDETFTSMRVSNSYQNSGFTALSINSNIKRKKRLWKMALPRNIVTNSITPNPDIFNLANLNTNQMFKQRIRDQWILVDLKFDNFVNNSFKKLILNKFSTIFRISIR